MKSFIIILILLSENPLSKLNDTLKRVLEEASLPFSEEQEQAIILMMDERQRASEELFGEIMDFRNRPREVQNPGSIRT